MVLPSGEACSRSLPGVPANMAMPAPREINVATVSTVAAKVSADVAARPPPTAAARERTPPFSTAPSEMAARVASRSDCGISARA